MRFTTTFFAAVAVLALLLDAVEPSGVLQVLYASAGMMALVWGFLVLVSGGPRKFYAVERQWREAASTPLPALVTPVAVATDQVVTTYRPVGARYGHYAKGIAWGAILAALPVLVYAVAVVGRDGWSWPAVAAVLVAVAGALLAGGGWVLLIFTRSRVEIHPNGVTLRGAFRTVVLDNTTNSLIIRGDARSGLHGLGSLWVDRATRRRCAVWVEMFDLPTGGLDPLLRGTVGRSVIREKPSRDIAPYVSLGERKPYLPLAIVVYVIVLVSTLVALSGR